MSLDEMLTSAEAICSPYNRICSCGFFIPAHQNAGATFLIVVAANSELQFNNDTSKITDKKKLFHGNVDFKCLLGEPMLQM